MLIFQWCNKFPVLDYQIYPIGCWIHSMTKRRFLNETIMPNHTHIHLYFSFKIIMKHYCVTRVKLLLFFKRGKLFFLTLNPVCIIINVSYTWYLCKLSQLSSESRSSAQFLRELRFGLISFFFIPLWVNSCSESCKHSRILAWSVRLWAE